MKKKYGYPTLKVICKASAGNETAIREILKFYDAYICKLCLRPFYHSESGKITMQVDEELKGQIHTCIFRKNCASVPEERSAIPLQTEQSSAG